MRKPAPAEVKEQRGKVKSHCVRFRVAPAQWKSVEAAKFQTISPRQLKARERAKEKRLELQARQELPILKPIYQLPDYVSSDLHDVLDLCKFAHRSARLY
jgi:hypothetical protein